MLRRRQCQHGEDGASCGRGSAGVHALRGGVSQEDHELHAHRRRQKRQNGERLAHGGGAVGTALDVGAGAKAFVFTRA